MNRIYITGCPRTGTTLLLRLMSAFRNVDIIDYEISIDDFIAHPVAERKVLVGKRTKGTVFTGHALPLMERNRQLALLLREDVAVINMLRGVDGVTRSGVVSEERWRWACDEWVKWNEKVNGLTIIYDDLLAKPDVRQVSLVERLITWHGILLYIEHPWSDYPGFVPARLFREHEHRPGYERRALRERTNEEVMRS